MSNIRLPEHHDDLEALLDAHEGAARCGDTLSRTLARAALVARLAAAESANRDERAAWSRCYALLTGDSGAYSLADLERAVKGIVARHGQAIDLLQRAEKHVLASRLSEDITLGFCISTFFKPLHITCRAIRPEDRP